MASGAIEGILVAGGEGCLNSVNCISGVELYPKLYLNNPRGIIIDDNGSLYISDDITTLMLIKIDNNQLVTKEIFDYETKSNYSIRVKATSSNGGYNYEKKININIIDLPDQINDISLDNFNIDENKQVGSSVGTFEVDDQSLSATHNFEFISGAGDDDNSSFTLVGKFLKHLIFLIMKQKQITQLELKLQVAMVVILSKNNYLYTLMTSLIRLTIFLWFVRLVIF